MKLTLRNEFMIIGILILIVGLIDIIGSSIAINYYNKHETTPESNIGKTFLIINVIFGLFLLIISVPIFNFSRKLNYTYYTDQLLKR